ncbi:MAG: hypothetical protein JNK78_09250 [Planctomycetes bacterium]|nr:hypothetical protein [Planctomycetota bacterium]
MTADALARTCSLIAAAALVAGCSSAPPPNRVVTVHEGQPTRVVLAQTKDGTTLLLQNASSADSAAFYGVTESRVLGKVIDDDSLQTLLDGFAERGMFAEATASAPSNVRDVLFVEQDGRRWVWSRRLAGVQRDEALFHQGRSYFLEVWNSTSAFRSAAPGVRPDLEGEDARAHRNAESAKGKLERLEGRKP